MKFHKLLISLLIAGLSLAASPSFAMVLEDEALVGGYFYDVAVSDTIAYVATGRGLGIFDISDPANPIEANEFEIPGEIQWLSLMDTILVVVPYGYESIRSYDISDPVYPVELDSLVVDYPVRPFRYGNYLYMRASVDGRGIQIISLNNPRSLEPVSIFTDQNRIRRCYTLTIANDNLCVVEDITDRVLIYSLENPDNPTFISSIDVGFAVFSCTSYSDYLYVIGREGETSIISITEPEHPFIVGENSIPWGIPFTAGNLLFISTEDGNEVSVYSLESPDSPSFLHLLQNEISLRGIESYDNTIFTVGESGFNIWLTDDNQEVEHLGGWKRIYLPSRIVGHDRQWFVLSGNYLFSLYRETANRTLVQDSVIVRTARQRDIEDLDLYRDHLYFLKQDSLLIIDCSANRDIRIVNVISTQAYSLFIKDNYLFITDIFRQDDGCVGMSIYDLSNPAIPERVSEYVSQEGGFIIPDKFDSNSGLVVAKTFTRDWQTMYEVISIANPLEPEYLSHFHMELIGNNYRGGAICNNFLLACGNFNDFTVVDLTDPAIPQVIRGYEDAKRSESIYTNDTLFVLGFRGTEMLQLNEEGEPALVDSHPFGGGFYKFDGDKVACADGNSVKFYSLSGQGVIGPIPMPVFSSLDSCFPNPFNASTSVSVTLPRSQNVIVNLVDISGRVILSKPFGWLETGTHNLSISAENVPSGLYFIQASLAGKTLMKPVVVMK